MKNLKVKNYVENFLATMSVNELPDFHREIVIILTLCKYGYDRQLKSELRVKT